MDKAAALLLILLLSILGCTVTSDAGALTAPIGLAPSINRGRWQYAVETRTDLVRLAIRDQAGQIGPYKAVFAITAPDNKRYRSEKNGSGAAPLTVAFPKDFGAGWTRGIYTWTCSVGQRQLLQGSFEYRTSSQIHILQANFLPENSPGR